jgi:hypothetical protein
MMVLRNSTAKQLQIALALLQATSSLHLIPHLMTNIYLKIRMPKPLIGNTC